MATPELVSIEVGDSICTLCPALGGSIARWSVDGQNMLRGADDVAIVSGDPLAMASFPLVPFSNRIAKARFSWQGQQIALTPNFAPEPYAIHGTGWRESWAKTEQSKTHCVLTLRHQADACWPWTFEASQSFTLVGRALIIELCATNRDEATAPLAFGHHPYFDQEGAQLTFAASHVLMSDVDPLATAGVAPAGQYDFSNGGMIYGRDIDHCYAGWDGQARIDWKGRKLALEIEADMAATIVYVPKGGGAFCFEPVPHINNALNRIGDEPAMPVVAPGKSFNATIRLNAV